MGYYLVLGGWLQQVQEGRTALMNLAITGSFLLLGQLDHPLGLELHLAIQIRQAIRGSQECRMLYLGFLW